MYVCLVDWIYDVGYGVGLYIVSGISFIELVYGV